MQRRAPKEIIESDKNPRIEQAYVKFAGRNLESIGKDRKEQGVSIDIHKLRKLWKQADRKRYTGLHTHVYAEGDNISDEKISALPSPEDVADFLMDENQKMEVIAQRNKYTGKLRGYLVLRKTKQTPKSNTSSVEFASIWSRIKRVIIGNDLGTKIPDELVRDISQYDRAMSYAQFDRDIATAKKGLESLADKYHLQIRFFKTKSPELKDQLTSVLTILSALCLFCSLTLLSNSVTGRVTGSLFEEPSFSIGAILFFIGALLGLVCIKRSKV